MAAKTTFKHCIKSRAKLPSTDHHDACLLCLSKEHNTAACKICCSFLKQTRTNRALHLRAALYNEALRPPTPHPSVPSTSRGDASTSTPPSKSGKHGSVQKQSKTVSAGKSFKRPLEVSSKGMKHKDKKCHRDSEKDSQKERSHGTPSSSSAQESDADWNVEVGRTSSVSVSTAIPKRNEFPMLELAGPLRPETVSTSREEFSVAKPVNSLTSTEQPAMQVERHLTQRHRSLSPAHTPQQLPSTPLLASRGEYQQTDRSATSVLRDLLDSASSTSSESTFRGFLSAGLDEEQEEGDLPIPPPKTPSISPRGTVGNLLHPPLAVVSPIAGQSNNNQGVCQPTTQPTHSCGFRHSLPHDYGDYLRWKAQQVPVPREQLPLQHHAIGYVEPPSGNATIPLQHPECSSPAAQASSLHLMPDSGTGAGTGETRREMKEKI